MKSRRTILFALLVCATIASAQNGLISVKVTRRSGDPVPSSTVTITNVSTGAVQKATVNQNGVFTSSVAPGTYKVEVESNGFKRTTVQNVEVSAGTTPQEITAVLDVGSATDNVEIDAHAPEAATEPGAISRTENSVTLQTIPVLDRNYQELSGLATGITPPVAGFSVALDPQRTRQFNADGLPVFANDNTSDGVTVREPFTGAISTRITPDENIVQLTTDTSTFRAEQGFAGGAISNMFSRSGGNGWHGALFGFHSQDYLESRNPLNSAGVIPDPHMRYWQAGAVAGGSIIPNKMFLTLSYQGTLNDSEQTQIATVPTAAILGGNFAGLGTDIFDPRSGTSIGTNRTRFGTIPPSRISPTGLALLNALPDPNLPGAANNLIANVPFSDDGHLADAKLEHRFTDAIAGFFRYGYSHYNADEGSIFGPVVGGATNAGLRNHYGVASLTASYTGWVAELRAGYSRFRDALGPDVATGPITSAINGLGAGGAFPSISIAGFGNLGPAANLPARLVDNTWDGSGIFHFYKGSHEFRAGVEVRDLAADGWTNYPFGPNGGFFFGPGPTSSVEAESLAVNVFANSIASVLLGSPTASGRFAYTTTPSYQQRQYAAFIGDTWRVTRDFSLDLGVRYDIFSPVETRNATGATIFDPVSRTVSLTGTGAIDSRGNRDYDYNNVSPRVGFAYRPIGDTVIRGGYAISYFPAPFSLSGINQAGVGIQNGFLNGSFASVPFTVPSLPAAPANGGPVPNFPFTTATTSATPYVQSYNFMIQQGLPDGLLFSVAYVGNQGRSLPFSRTLNIGPANTNAAGLPFNPLTAEFNEVGTGLNSNYNSVQANLTKRLSHGIAFSAAYTFGKALDYGTNLFGPFDRSSNYGPADWDRQHILTISHIFQLPFGNGTHRLNTGALGNILAGWQWSGMFRWATGTPYTVVGDPIGCSCPNAGLLPVPFSGTPVNNNGLAAFDPTAFEVPDAEFGTLSRNIVRGPDFHTYDMAIFKSFLFREKSRLELRAEAYNVFNTTVFANPPAVIGSPDFGRVTSTLNGIGGRQFVLGARILF